MHVPSDSRMTLRDIVAHLSAGTVLRALAGLVVVTRSIHPPASMQRSIGLGGFELLLSGASSMLMLATLLLVSHFEIAWPTFLHPPDYRSSGFASLRFCALALAVGTMFFFGFAVLSISYGLRNMPEPPPVMALDESIPSIMALIVVIATLAFARALILFGIEHRSRDVDPM